MSGPAFLRRFGIAWREARRSRDRGFRTRQAFSGATFNRLYQGWRTTTTQIDDEIRGSIRAVRARARDLRRNDAYVGQYARLLVNNVLGHAGFELQPRVTDGAGNLAVETNRRITEAWQQWSRARVTVDGVHTWHSLQKLALQTVAVEGECFIRIVRGWPFNSWGLAFEPIDPDLVDETFNRTGGPGINEIRMGIEIDAYGRRVGYHVWTRPQSMYAYATRERQFVPAEDMIHLMDPLRFWQTRGASWINPVILTSHRRDCIEEAEEIATYVGAAKMGVLQSKEGSLLGEEEGDEAIEIEANPGTFVQLPKGWELNSWNPEHPNQGLWEYLKHLLRRIASGLGIGYNAMANDYEGVTWTSLRQNNLVDRDEWRQIQTWWAESWLDPAYPVWLNAALLSRQLVLESWDYRRYTRVVWQPRGWETVQPLDDVQAAERQIALGLTTRTRVAAESGRNYEENLKQLAREEDLARAIGVSVAGLGGDVVPTADNGAIPAPPAKAGTNGSGKARAMALHGGRF